MAMLNNQGYQNTCLVVLLKWRPPYHQWFPHGVDSHDLFDIPEAWNSPARMLYLGSATEGAAGQLLIL